MHCKISITINIKSNARLKDDKKDTLLEQNKTHIAHVYFTKPARTFICRPKLNIFLKQFQQCSIFNCIRNEFPDFWSRRLGFFLEWNCFSGYKAFQQNEICISWCQALYHILPYKILLLKFVDLFDGYSLFHLF